MPVDQKGEELYLFWKYGDPRGSRVPDDQEEKIFPFPYDEIETAAGSCNPFILISTIPEQVSGVMNSSTVSQGFPDIRAPP